jgi:hypothetical protein
MMAVGRMVCMSSASWATERAIGDLRARHHGQEVAGGALQHVRQRQEGQELVLLVDVDDGQGPMALARML